MLAGDASVQLWGSAWRSQHCFSSLPAALGAGGGTRSIGIAGNRNAMNSAWPGDGRAPGEAQVTPSGWRGSASSRQDRRHADESVSVPGPLGLPVLQVLRNCNKAVVSSVAMPQSGLV